MLETYKSVFNALEFGCTYNYILDDNGKTT